MASNFYTIQKHFDDAVAAINIPVNDGSKESTDDIDDGIKAFTNISDIETAEEQVANHVTFDFNYNLEFIRGLVDTSESGLAERQEQAANDWLNIVTALYGAIESGPAQNVTIVEGEYLKDVEKPYQSYGRMTLRANFKHQIC